MTQPPPAAASLDKKALLRIRERSSSLDRRLMEIEKEMSREYYQTHLKKRFILQALRLRVQKSIRALDTTYLQATGRHI